MKSILRAFGVQLLADFLSKVSDMLKTLTAKPSDKDSSNS